MSTDYRKYVAGLPLLDALWWFIENNDGLKGSTDIFFDLRERVRTHVAPADPTKLIKAVKSLLSDIEAMQVPNRDGYLNLDEDQDPKNFFGPFSTYTLDFEDAEYTGAAFEWPNLTISAEDARKALAEYG